MGVGTIEKTIFDAIYHDNAEIVYKVARKYSGNHHAAEEISQAVFLKFYMNIEHINVEAARSWLILTAKYMALNVKRDSKRECLSEEPTEEGDVSVSVDESSEDVFFRKLKEREDRELVEDIFEALYRDNPRWYEAITITYILEKPQKEVAEVMGVSLEVLHSMLYRAKRWIQKNYEAQYDDLDKA